MHYLSKSLEPEPTLPYAEPQVAKKKLYLNTHPHTFMSESFQRSLFPEPQVKHQYSMCSYTLVATSKSLQPAVHTFYVATAFLCFACLWCRQMS